MQSIAQQEQGSPVSAANTPQAMHTVNSYCEVHCMYKGIAVIWRSKIENMRCTQIREEGPLRYFKIEKHNIQTKIKTEIKT